MSFLKELKEDLSLAVNELINEEEVEVSEEVSENETLEEDIQEVNTLDVDIDTIENLLEDESKEEIEEDVEMEKDMDDAMMTDLMEELNEIEEETDDLLAMDGIDTAEDMDVADNEVETDEVTEITKGTVIEGNISSSGSLNVYGKIKGNVSCKGKLMIAGIVVGESSAKEIFVNNAKVEGDVKSEGTIKIANGSVIIGNVYATSAVVAGAVKGDIDVHGPVIVDGTAVVKGDIKSRSVQINNGAAIEGFCSQCYADIDYKTLFDETFGQ